jgi:hypothetical protein
VLESHHAVKLAPLTARRVETGGARGAKLGTPICHGLMGCRGEEHEQACGDTWGHRGCVSTFFHTSLQLPHM